MTASNDDDNQLLTLEALKDCDGYKTRFIGSGFDYVFDVRMVKQLKRLAGADLVEYIMYLQDKNIQYQYPTVGHISYGTDEQA